MITMCLLWSGKVQFANQKNVCLQNCKNFQTKILIYMVYGQVQQLVNNLKTVEAQVFLSVSQKTASIMNLLSFGLVFTIQSVSSLTMNGVNMVHVGQQENIAILRSVIQTHKIPQIIKLKISQQILTTISNCMKILMTLN